MLENIAYTGVLRSGETYSEPFEDLRIVSDDLFQRACALRKSRSRKTERTVPMSSKSQSLLSGNIFCGHCGGRLTPSRSGKNRLLKDGTMSNTIRYTYVCYNQNRKRKDCDGPCTYTCHIVDDVVIDVIRNLLGKLTDSPKDALMESLGQNKLSESQKQINETKTNLDTAQKILDNVNKEVLASITGESPYSKEQISVVLQEQNNKVAALSERLESLLQLKKNSQKSMAESANMLENIYTWAESFDKVDLQSKKMIAANLVKKIIVHRDYKIQIELNVDIEALALAVGESIPLKIAS